MVRDRPTERSRMDKTSGLISGTPTAVGTANVTITVVDSTPSKHLTTSVTRSIQIVGALTVTTSVLPVGVAHSAYPATLLNAAGGTSPYTWAVAGLPSGLVLNSATGQITGTPAAAGKTTIQITVTDSGVPSARTAKANLALTVVDPLTIGNGPLPTGSVGSNYSGTATATGGTPPYTWSAAGLPATLTIAPTTGLITGIPAAPGTLSFTLTVKDSTPGGGLITSASRSIVVLPKLGITTTSLPTVVVGISYTAALNAVGGTKPYSWSATGLPSGLSIDAATGTVTGSCPLPNGNRRVHG